MENYYRITGYSPQQDFCFILDCYGKFEKLWQFSSLLVQKGIQVLEVGKTDKFLAGQLDLIQKQDTNNLICRAIQKGKPQYTTYLQDGVQYKAVTIDNKAYIPDKTQTV